MSKLKFYSSSKDVPSFEVNQNQFDSFELTLKELYDTYDALQAILNQETTVRALVQKIRWLTKTLDMLGGNADTLLADTTFKKMVGKSICTKKSKSSKKATKKKEEEKLPDFLKCDEEEEPLWLNEDEDEEDYFLKRRNVAYIIDDILIPDEEIVWAAFDYLEDEDYLEFKNLRKIYHHSIEKLNWKDDKSCLRFFKRQLQLPPKIRMRTRDIAKAVGISQPAVIKKMQKLGVDWKRPTDYKK